MHIILYMYSTRTTSVLPEINSTFKVLSKVRRCNKQLIDQGSYHLYLRTIIFYTRTVQYESTVVVTIYRYAGIL
jgi:hypothetical protein